MLTITEQLSELQAKVQKLEAISVTANTVTLQMQEQLSNLQRNAIEGMSSKTEPRKRVSKAKAKEKDSKSVHVTSKRK